jgi:tRNA dimethylallyltransferase
VLVLGGPTAAGKSDAALAVAERFGATVVSADAMQVYRGMDVGTGKVSAADRARAPHLGIDVVDPHEAFDASDFCALAEAAIAQGPVVIAGGTSLYLQALRRGLVNTPPPDPALRAQILALPSPHARLAEVDPPLAARLHPNDLVRVLRGVEVFEQTGQRLSALQAAHAAAPDRYEVVGLWLDRDDLEARIDARVLQMMADGYVEEVRRLLRDGVDRSVKPMLSLGYRHLAAHVLDGLDLEEAVRLTQRDTRRFAHKQRTWQNTLGYRPVAGGDLDAVLRVAHEVLGGSTGRGPGR